MPDTSINTSIIESRNVRRLHQGEIMFSQISFDTENAVTFRMPVMFDVREVLGVPTSPGDKVTAAAHYDLLRHASFNTLDISIKTEGGSYSYRYLLTGSERADLTRMMETYYLQSTGSDLKMAGRELQAGTVPPPKPKPRT